MLIGLLPLAQQVYADKADEYLARTMAEAAKFRNTPSDVLPPNLHADGSGQGSSAGGNPLSLIRDRMRDQIKGTSKSMTDNCAAKWIAQQQQHQQQQQEQLRQQRRQQRRQQQQQQRQPQGRHFAEGLQVPAFRASADGAFEEREGRQRGPAGGNRSEMYQA
jgi:hypothetical protein